jgi:hypothetical protein
MLIYDSVSTSIGQPSRTIYDWNLGIGWMESSHKLSQEISNRLHIAKFCERVTETLYSNPSDFTGLAPESEQPSVIANLKTQLQILEMSYAQFSRKSF